MSVPSFPSNNLRLKSIISWATLEKHRAKINPSRIGANDNRTDLFRLIILFQNETCLQFPGQTHRANPNWKCTQPLQTHCWNMTDTSGTRKFLLETTCFLAKAEMVKQYRSAAVAFRAHSGASCSWGEWNWDSLASWHCRSRDKICMASPSKSRAVAGRTPWACQVKGIFFFKGPSLFFFL